MLIVKFSLFGIRECLYVLQLMIEIKVYTFRLDHHNLYFRLLSRALEDKNIYSYISSKTVERYGSWCWQLLRGRHTEL